MDPVTGASAPRNDRTDSVLKIVLLVLLAGVLGLGALFVVTVVQSRTQESSATPAQRALIELREFVRKNPNSAGARVRYGEALGAAGLLDEAAEQFKAAIKIDEGHTGAWLDLGLIAMQSKKPAEAERYFQKVVDLTTGTEYEHMNARRETALFHLGEIALDAKRYEDAAGYFKESLRIRRDAADTYYLLAQALHGMGSDDAAMERLEAALAFDPGYGEANFLYGQLWLARKDKVEAAYYFYRAYVSNPERPEVKKALEQFGTSEEAMARARAALKKGNGELALEESSLARSLAPESVEAALLRAEVLVYLNKKKDAKGAIKAVLELDPENKKAKELQKLLAK